jgi:transposase
LWFENKTQKIKNARSKFSKDRKASIKMARKILTEKAWIMLQEVLKSIGFYLTANSKNYIEGMLWRLRTGSPWRDLPPEFGYWNSVYRRYNRWNKDGKMDEILENVEGDIDYRTAYLDGTYVPVHQHATEASPKGTDQATGISRAGLTTKIHAAAHRKGNPAQIEVTAGNISDITEAEVMIDDLAPIFNELVASDSFRMDLMAEGCMPVIPIKSNSKRRNPGFHKAKYKNRHRVENLFARLKHMRGIATRFDKLGVMYEGTVKLGIIVIWLGLTV